MRQNTVLLRWEVFMKEMWLTMIKSEELGGAYCDACAVYGKESDV